MSELLYHCGMTTTRIPLANTTAKSALADVIIRARHLAGWSQMELAARSGSSKGTIWRLEHDKAAVLDLAVVEKVLKALGVRATLELDGRHFLDRERQMDSVHAWLNGYVARRLRRCGFEVATEVLIDEGGPRGWIDLLAYREADGTLIVEETKTDLPDIGGLQRSIAFYERMARRAAAALGWKVRRVVVLCVVLDSAEIAARIAGARDLLAMAFPGDVGTLARLLVEPGTPAPTGWCLAATDPASRERTWLRGTALTRRRRAPAYQGYAEAAALVRARSGEAARPPAR
jgi:transcriptional regulator with XRE-family HTH domain